MNDGPAAGDGVGAGPHPAEERGVGAPRGQTLQLRFRYTKLGKIRFTSHRDVARMWERALRRTGLAVAWSEGFSPRPLLSFGLALPTGCESLAEYLDVRLDASAQVGPSTPSDLARQLSELLPEGVGVPAGALAPPGRNSLQQEVTFCDWELEVDGLAPEELATRVERLLGASSVAVRRERKGRPVQDDLRPAVLALSVADRQAAGAGAQGPTPRCRLLASLATQPRGVRPGELLEGLGGGLMLAWARRTHQWIERDGARWEPLEIPGHGPDDSVWPAARRAS